MNNYDHQQIEKKWQAYWTQHNAHVIDDEKQGSENKYILVEFPYPSGNLHIGHWYAFALPDILVRTKRMQGNNVLFPMGFDAFGLPAENAALKNNVNPREWTNNNIEYMTSQLRTMGGLFDWSRSLSTCDPEYYQWTQWLFMQFLKNDLAYQAETNVNWCPSCKTVLANEQVAQGKCERCDSDIKQRKMKQWMLRITNYAEKLLAGLDTLNWPDEIKESQRNWIGKSNGINISYDVENTDDQITVYTTRPDTNFGATFIVVAPESKFVEQHLEQFPNKEAVEVYIKEASKKTELERISDGRKKTGVDTGLVAINNLNQKKLPIYVSDFVLAHVGTGAVVGVPGHDLRDFEFAQSKGIEIVRVVVGPDQDDSPITQPEQVQEESGVMINSGFIDGMEIMAAKEKIMDYLEEQGWGKRVTQYKLRDWLVSRQRYWGCPIPIVHCASCGAVPVPEDALPVKLPELDDYKPRDDGKSPLAKATDWVNVPCPTCGIPAERETDTLDTFVDSSWYFLRYCDPHNSTEFASLEKMKQWMPVDIYSGGAEHTTMHLLYSRFFTHVMHDLTLIPWNEPYTIRRNRALIMGPDGQKMSKSRGNVVDPDENVKKFGADAVRMYLAFIGPYNEVGSYPWDMNGIIGIKKFLDRVWMLQEKLNDSDNTTEITKLLHQSIKK